MQSGGSSTIKGGNITGTNDNGVFISSGNCTISGGTLKGGNSGITSYGGTVTIKGGTFTGNTYYGAGQNNSSTASMNISGGTFTGRSWGIWIGTGSYTQSGSPIINSGSAGSLYIHP